MPATQHRRPATFILLQDYATPALPTEENLRRWVGQLRALVGIEESGPFMADDRLQKATMQRLDEVVAPPACGPLLDELDRTIAQWLDSDSGPRPQGLHVKVVVLPPCEESVLLQTCSATARPLRSPSWTTALTMGMGMAIGACWWCRGWRTGWCAIAADSTRCAGCSRHSMGCTARSCSAATAGPGRCSARRLVRTCCCRRRSRCARSTRRGCTSGLPSLLATSRPVRCVFGCRAPAGTCWRKTHKACSKAMTSKSSPAAAWASPGSPGICGGAACGPTSSRPKGKMPMPTPIEARPGHEQMALLTLQALPIHGAMAAPQLRLVLPVAKDAGLLAALVHAGFLTRDGDCYTCAPAAYPATRSALAAAGFSVNGF